MKDLTAASPTDWYERARGVVQQVCGLSNAHRCITVRNALLDAYEEGVRAGREAHKAARELGPIVVIVPSPPVTFNVTINVAEGHNAKAGAL